MTKEQIEALGITYVEGMTDDEVFDKITENKKALDAKTAELEGKVKTYKASIDKLSSENANYKKEKQEKLTDEEKAQAHLAEVEAELAKANRKIAESERVSSYVTLGYPKDLAEKVAVAELDGKDASKYHQEFIKSREEAVKAEIMKQNPGVKGGAGNGGNEKFTKENFKAGKLGMEELTELKANNPALYEAVTGGE